MGLYSLILTTSWVLETSTVVRVNTTLLVLEVGTEMRKSLTAVQPRQPPFWPGYRRTQLLIQLISISLQAVLRSPKSLARWLPLNWLPSQRRLEHLCCLTWTSAWSWWLFSAILDQMACYGHLRYFPLFRLRNLLSFQLRDAHI